MQTYLERDDMDEYCHIWQLTQQKCMTNLAGNAIYASLLRSADGAECVENGEMTKDLAILIGPSSKYLTTNQFLDAIDSGLKKKLN